jgi:hypothetical protein
MKIKDAVVIELNLLESLLDDFNKCMIENGNSKVERKIINNHIVVINKIINKSKPLEPIVKDAWNKKDTTLFDYLNDTEL